MLYFKAVLEVTNFKKQKDERVMYLQARDIIHAMDMTRRIRGSQFKTILPISYSDYMSGVDLKYKN